MRGTFDGGAARHGSGPQPASKDRAPAPNTAKLFMEYLLSKDANEIMVKFRQDPVNVHVKPLPGGKSIAEVKTVRPSYEEIDKGIPEVKELFRDTFGI